MAKDRNWRKYLPKEEGQFVIVVKDHDNLGVSFKAGQVLELVPTNRFKDQVQYIVKVDDTRKSVVLIRYCSSIYPNRDWAERDSKRRFNKTAGT